MTLGAHAVAGSPTTSRFARTASRTVDVGRGGHAGCMSKGRQGLNLFQVNLFVDDFPSMLGFYRDVLGFETNDIEPGPPCVQVVNWASLLSGR
jgi:hypothetical protein